MAAIGKEAPIIWAGQVADRRQQARAVQNTLAIQLQDRDIAQQQKY
jgi:hypothetical protein